MTKAELQELLEIREKEVSRISNERNELREKLKLVPEQIENAKKDMEDKIYKEWKYSQEKFLNRFIGEYLKEHLSIEVECSEGGYVDANLYVDKEQISNGFGQVCMYRSYED